MTLERACTRWTTGNSLFVLWLCSCVVPLSAANLLIFVIDGNEADTDNPECEGRAIKIGCKYDNTLIHSSVTLTTGDPPVNLPLEEETSWETFSYAAMSYTVRAGGAIGTHSYECAAGAYIARATIHFDRSSDCSGPTTSSPSTTGSPSTQPATSDPSTGSTDGTTASSSTNSEGSTNSGQTSFKGLKPLIYTVASVVLLGTLAIVAIITCWIRARRSFHSRMIRPNNTPQDYLDYISDNEFTPLTTSEFLASLQERPPTYNQSEEMTQQDGTSDGEGGGETSGTQLSREQHPTTAAPNTSLGGTNEGVVVERRRARGGSAERERGRRRRRVVIIESSGAEGSSESTVTVASTQGSGVTVITHEEEGGATNSQPPPHPSSHSDNTTTPADNSTSADNSTAPETDKILSSEGSSVTMQQLVPLESIGDTTEHSQSPSQQEIGVIEARVSMVEGISPPPISEHHATPPAATSGTLTSDEESSLIDFSAPPLPSAFSIPSV